jgi:predicted DNA-binding transcriptional regulator AlpA
MSNEKLSYTETEVEALTGIKRKTLHGWRFRGTGPRWIKGDGRLVRYPAQALHDWISSQPGGGQDAEIRARVTGLQEAVTERAVEKAALNRAWVLDRLRDNVERAMNATAPTDENGWPYGTHRYGGQVANRALELIGKELGMFKSSQEVTGGGAPQKIEVVFVGPGERNRDDGDSTAGVQTT